MLTALLLQVGKLNMTFEMLIRVISPFHGVDSDRSNEVVSSERQLLLHNMNAHVLVMDFIRESSYIVSEHVKSDRQAAQAHKDIHKRSPSRKSKKGYTSHTIIESGIFQQAYRFLELFCRNNVKHQLLLHESLRTIEAQLGATGSRRIASLGQNRLISAIFHGNPQLCKRVSKKLMISVASQIEKCGALKVFLRIPRTIVKCNSEKPLRTNQDLVVQYLVGKPNEVGELGSGLKIKILKAAATGDEISKMSNREREQQMGYEAELCLLLADCCQDNMIAQLKCQVRS